jgi:tetratricopeptide (TPR) repeat protein
MTVVPATLTGVALSLLLVAPAKSGPKSEFFVAHLENGINVGFALVRSGAEQPGSTLGEVVFPRSSGLSRVLFDDTEGVYFGYRLEVSRADKRLKVTIRPLGGDVAQELRDHSACPTCKPPKLLSAALARTPAPLSLADGDIVTIELLVNSATGEKIVDVVKLATQQFQAETMRAAAERAREALRVIQRADILAARAAYDDAIREYRRALELNPNDAVVQNKLGISYQQAAQRGRAEDQYRQALRVNPAYAEAWNNLGSLQHASGDFKQAIKNYQKAVDLKPSFATAYRNMGMAYLSLGQFDQAYAAFIAAYRIDPSILEGSAASSVSASGVGAADQSFFFAKVSAKNGQIDQACGHLRRAQAAGYDDWKRVTKDPDFEVVVRSACYLELTGARTPKQ